MIGNIILVLPITFLLSGVVYCTVCVWKASKGIPIDKVRKENTTPLLKELRHERLMDLLFYIALFLPIAVSGVVYKKRVSDQEVTLAVFFDSFNTYVYALIINLVCKTEIVSILHKFNLFSALFSKKSSVVILSIILWSVIGFGSWRAFFSNNVLDEFFSSESIFQSTCIVVSFVLIISAAFTYTRKMLEYVKN